MGKNNLNSPFLNDEQEIRFQCLLQANQVGLGNTAAIVSAAREFEKYVTEVDNGETLDKVRLAIENYTGPKDADNIISDLQNKGILFRERE